MKKRPHLATKKVLFHFENAPAYSSAIATAKLVELRYELLPHPPYSPDLARFPLVPKHEAVASDSNEEVIAATEAYFAEFDKPYFLDDLKKLEYRCIKCIELKGDYIEK